MTVVLEHAHEFDATSYRFYEQNRDLTLLSLALAGSHGYGTATESSDLDFRGVFVGNNKQLLGFKSGPTSVIQDKDGLDNHFWEIRHFFKMCCDGNPNVIETLWAPDYRAYNDYSQGNDIVGSQIRGIRDRFLSKKLGRTYMGYAVSNWKRAIKVSYSKSDPKLVTTEVNWKDLMHLIRLIRTGRETLETGIFRPRRDEDREFFLSIKAGKVGLDVLEVEFNAAKADWDGLIAKSTLPDVPDENYLNAWLTSYLEKRIMHRAKAERTEYADD